MAWAGSATCAGSGWLHGLKVAAVAVVAQAVLGMMRTLAPDRQRATLGGRGRGDRARDAHRMGPGRRDLRSAALSADRIAARARRGRPCLVAAERRAGQRASRMLVLFFVLLVGLPLARRRRGQSQSVKLVDAFYRAGSLVFGGGHVVLPLLQASVVPPGWVSNDAFLAGYGAAQAVPGPLFTFAAYLGAVMGPPPNGWIGRRSAWSPCSFRLSC